MEQNILIVEDDAFIAEDMADIVQDGLNAKPIVASSCREALSKINRDTVLGFLDINVADGTTYDLARRLRNLGIPLVFVSGNSPDKLPTDLKDLPYILKPAESAAIVRLARTLSADLPG